MKIRLLILLLAVLSLTSPGWAAQFEEILPGVFPSTTGAAWSDYDNDGYPDLLLAGAGPGLQVPVAHGPLLYLNNHDLAFTDLSQAVGLDSTDTAQLSVTWGDYDNDGMVDAFVGAAGYPFLYQQTAAGLTNVGKSAGWPQLTNHGSAWGDYNADSLLDVFCANSSGPPALMRNNGDGTFTNVTTAAGLAGATSGESAAWGDFANSGRPGLVVARARAPLMLFRNNGDGTFTDVSAQSGVNVAVDCLSAIWGDYDNDGWLDLYVTAGPYLNGSGNRHWLFRNNHDGTFTDVTAAAGLSMAATVGGGAAWVDYDNDGYLDLYVTNWHHDPYLYHNNGNGTFTNMVAGSGLESPFDYQGGAATWGDMDLDGRMDLFQCTLGTTTATDRSLLYHNVGPAGNWLRVEALTSSTGDATDPGQPTREAIGARVEVNLDNDTTFPTAAHHTLTRVIDGGSGWQGQNEQIAQFGLGTASLVAVRVRFPDGSVVVHQGVAANQQTSVADIPAGRTVIFTDIPLDYYAYPQILAVKKAGIAGGYPDGTYRPTLPVSRDQMAVYISRAAAGGDSAVPTGPTTPSFPDVPTDYWAYKYIEYVRAQGIVGGYPDGTYQPASPVDRGQMAIFIARSIVYPTGDLGLRSYVPPTWPTFTDVSTVFYAFTYIEYIRSKGIAGGYPDGKYHPEAVVTRDQMGIYIARAFGLAQ